MLAWVRYWNQWRPPLKSGCYWCRPNYQLSISFHTSASLHSMVQGWMLDPVKTAASTLAIQYTSDRNSGVRRTVRKYIRTTAAAAWMVGGLSSDNRHSRGHQIDWIHHLWIQIKLRISSSHLQLESLSCHLIVLQRMRCKNYTQARNSAVCRPLMSLLSVCALLVVNALTRSLKSTVRSRAVRIFHCHCISVCLLNSNCHSLFGFFFQITGVGNSNRAFKLFKFLNQRLHPYRLFTLVVTADCACLKLMVWKLLQLQILWTFYPAACAFIAEMCKNRKKTKPGTGDWKPNRIEPNLKNPNRTSPIRHVSTIGRKLVKHSNISPTCPYNMVNFGLLVAEIVLLVWGTPANFNGSRVLAALLHGTLVLGVSKTLWHWTAGATYIWQGGHHVGHWPTF